MGRGLILLILLISISAQSQSSFGGYSNQIEWKQINTKQVRVIFPDSLEKRAQRVVNIIHYMNDNNTGLLGDKRKKFDLILRNRDAISNGYAQIAPLKTEFFMQAPQKTFEESSVDWTDQLALHEYRHINQFLNSRRGLGRIVYWLFGDYGWGGVIGTTAPAWFVEGDATINETALSSGGRGRVPSFSAFLRAQQLEGVNYSYMKALNGSFKDFVPNHYNTGYLILSEMRRDHDNADFDEITRQASSYKGIIYPFRKAVKRVTNKSIKEHYFTAGKKLLESIPSSSAIPSKLISQEKQNDVVQFDNPLQDGGELYFSYGDRKDLRGIFRYNNDGKHERITYRGLILDTYFDKHEKLFVWSELQRDLRRGNQNFSNIILFDQEKETKTIIGIGERYFSPSFSRDGKNLIFVNGFDGSKSAISMMNLKSNALLDIITSRTKQFLYPVQDEEGRSIFAVVKEGHFYAICKVEMDGSFSLLSEWDSVVFGPLKASEGHLIFHANYNSRDQIYALNTKTRQLSQLSDDPIGMYNPSNYANGRVVAARPHSRGYLLHEVETDLSGIPLRTTKNEEELPYYLKTDHLEPDDILHKVPSDTFEISRYPRNIKIFRPHSWLAATDGVEYSATVFSDNTLNNVNTEVSYTYNANVQGSFVDFTMNYGRWFPIYQVNYSAGLPRMAMSSDGERRFEVSQQALRPGVIIPMNLTRGIYATSLRLAASVDQIYSFIKDIDSEEEARQQGTTLNNVFTFSHTRFKALQNLYPRWGYAVQVRNRYRFNDGHNAFNLANDIYLPGFHRNHGFKFEIDYAQQNGFDDDRIQHVDVFNYAAGFRSVEFDNIWSVNTNYTFPIVYPDWGFADFLYFKRLHSVVFHNYNNINSQDGSDILQAVGGDLLFDVVFNNTIFSEITIGFRNAYMIGNLPEGRSNPYHFDFIINIPAF